MRGRERRQKKLVHQSAELLLGDRLRDIGMVIVLDGIDILPDGFQVRSHDLHGQLPEIVIGNSGDTFRDKDRLAIEACKLIAIVKLRDEMVRFLPGCMFLKPTHMDGKAVVGLQAMPLTRIVEGEDFLAAYHELHRRVVG
jgi:hypothetical protein